MPNGRRSQPNRADVWPLRFPPRLQIGKVVERGVCIQNVMQMDVVEVVFVVIRATTHELPVAICLVSHKQSRSLMAKHVATA
jgi:hypothetical protein